MNARPAAAEWSGEEYGLPFPDGTPLLRGGQLLAGPADAPLSPGRGSFPALHVVVASGGYLAAACDRRIPVDATMVTSAAKSRLGSRCRRPACTVLFATVKQQPPSPAPLAPAPGPSVFRCAACGHGANLRARAHVNIHGDVGPDGHIDPADYEDDYGWPVIEESVTCKVHGEDHVEKLFDGRYTAHFDITQGLFVAATAASPGGRR